VGSKAVEDELSELREGIRSKFDENWKEECKRVIAREFWKNIPQVLGG